jgi:beta-lactamase superfamily II metal-dependent hydrolase
MNRREFLRNSSGAAVLGAMPEFSHALELQDPAVGAPFLAWREGYLDLHHINTGRGNSTLVVMPDGTSLLIDAGAAGTAGAAMCAARPDATRRPGEWIARYVHRQLNATGSKQSDRLDYALVTHLHGDHVGDVTEASPASKEGSYRLTGISDVAASIGIARLIDRGFPAYNRPVPAKYPAAENYVAFARSAVKTGMRAERVQVGSARQIAMLRGHRSDLARYPEFDVKVIAGDGAVALNRGEESRWVIPPGSGNGADAISAENGLSIALRLRYGKFSYYTGGDLNCDTNYGSDPWRDVETPAAQACGAVSVATCNHHGYFDANGPEFVRTLKARVWLLQSWHASHPALSTLANLYSTELYAGPRDVFSLGLHPAAELVCDRFAGRLKSRQGHVVVRVEPGGDAYRVMVVEDGDESGRVKAVFGPYTS